MNLYQPRRIARSRRLDIRGVAYHLREWGAPEAPPLILLHGAQDASAGFQFLVDALEGDWHVMAPDWRGHGLSGWTTGSYWQAEFVADLDVLLEVLLPDAAARIVGHSMGGNIASLYAGMRPDRVAWLVMLDALGDLLNRTPVQADTILRAVLEARHAGRGRCYRTTAERAERLMQANRRLSPTQAAFLADAIGRTTEDGQFGWAHDPSFRRSQPTMRSAEDWGAVWRGITAPVLGIMSSDPRPFAPAGDPTEAARRRGSFRNLRHITIPDTGHNLHHDAPAAVAAAIEAFHAASSEAAA